MLRSPTGHPPARLDGVFRDVRSIYVHVPFCVRHCPYCDFAISVAKTGEIVAGGLGDLFLDAIDAEIARVPPTGPIRTLYLGGGTPSALSVGQLGRLFDSLHRGFNTSGATEITVEVNPEHLDHARLETLLAGGTTRLSVGSQSFDNPSLRFLGRRHEAAEIRAAVRLARAVGIRQVSLDLIFALPNQTADDLDRDIDSLLELDPDHVSVYCLTYEPGTPLTGAKERGGVIPLEEEVELELYRRCVKRLESAGFDRYEISNFARPGARSRHNRVYWRNRPYLGLGPSAVSYIDGERRKNEPSFARWAELVQTGDPHVERETLDRDATVRESVMLALRTRHGVRDAQLVRRFGAGFDRLNVDELRRFRDASLVDWTDERLRLTSRGFELADAVAASLI